MAEREGDGGPASPWSEVGRYSGLGLSWALSTLLFLAAGWWLDGKVGSAPLLTILGAFVGGGAGFYHLYLQLMNGRKDGDDG